MKNDIVRSEKLKSYSLYKILFVYMVATNLLQILLIDSKGNIYDSLWKIFTLGMLILYAIFKSFKNNLKISKRKMFFWGIFVLLSLIVLIFNGDIIDFNSSIMVSFLFPLISSFIFLVLFGQLSMNKVDLKKFLQLFIFYVLYMCIYNMVVNYDMITNFMNITSAYQVDIASFYNNRNTFAYYLIFGIICVTVMLKTYDANKKIYGFILLIFVFNILLTLSRTAILSVIIFYLLLFFYNSKTKHKFIFCLSVFLCLTVVFTVPSLNSFISNNIIRAESGVTGRSSVWNFGIELFKNSNILVGLGYDEPHAILTRSYFEISSFHSTFLTILLCGGIFLFSGFVGIIIFSFVTAFNIKKYDRNLGLFFISIIIVYLCYSVTESQIIFFPSSTNFIATTFVCLIPNYILNSFKEKSDRNAN